MQPMQVHRTRWVTLEMSLLSECLEAASVFCLKEDPPPSLAHQCGVAWKRVLGFCFNIELCRAFVTPTRPFVMMMMLTRGIGLYGTGILFEEPNPTGSRPRDLIGLCKQQTKPRPPNVLQIPRCDMMMLARLFH